QKKYGFALSPPLVKALAYGLRGDAVSFQKRYVSKDGQNSFDLPEDSLAWLGLKCVYFEKGNLFFPRSFRDSRGQGMFAVPFQTGGVLQDSIRECGRG